jgi:hypothetical protein
MPGFVQGKVVLVSGGSAHRQRWTLPMAHTFPHSNALSFTSKPLLRVDHGFVKAPFQF